MYGTCDPLHCFGTCLYLAEIFPVAHLSAGLPRSTRCPVKHDELGNEKQVWEKSAWTLSFPLAGFPPSAQLSRLELSFMTKG